MKALKKICTALMILAFAFVFASCSNGSDSDDDDSSTNVLLPSSVGENVLAGNSYKYEKTNKTTTYKFKDNTVTKTKVKIEGESSETEIEEYKYTYDANTGLLSLNLVSMTIDDKTMTSMDAIYRYYAEEYDMTVEEVKEEFGDDDMFKEITSMCYFVKDNGNILLLGNYFANEKDVKYSKFVCENDEKIEVDFGDEKIEVDNVKLCDIKLNATEKTFSDAKIAGSYTVEKATKTLKDLNGVEGLDQANGYITINFSKLPNTLKSNPYNMAEGTEYKFIFDLDCDEYIKQ